MMSDKVMANYDPTRKIRVYCDDGPLGLRATVAQEYSLQGGGRGPPNLETSHLHGEGQD